MSLNYSPLTYQSFGYQNEGQFLQNYGQNYGYLGKYNYQTQSPSNGYRVGDYVFSNKDYYDQLTGILGQRASFLDTQQQSNPLAYSEYTAKPYAFTGSDPFKTAAQKAAEAEAARQASTTAAQGGTTTNSTVTQTQPGGKTGQTTSVANLVPLPVPTTDQLPEYIPPNNNALIKELKKLLGNIPGFFNTKGITNAFQKRAGIDEAFGSQAASNAAAQFSDQQSAQGGDPSLAGLVRAQALLPVLQHTAQLKSDLQDKKLKARSDQAGLTANVAEALGNLRTNYLKGLIDYTGKIQDIQSTNQISTQRLNEQSREFDLGHQLDTLRLQLQQRQQGASEKQDKLRALLALADLQGRRKPEEREYQGDEFHRFGTDLRNVDNIEYNDSLQALLSQIGALT